mgnify:CR=1 FL=1
MSEQLIIFSQIVFIDLILAGDNAIIIGMVASKFPPNQRKKVIFWGIGGAVVLRIILTLLTAYLLQITGLRLVGGILLLYVIYKLYTDVIKGEEVNNKDIKIDRSNLLRAIWTILLADFTMSLDNVLGVAGAAGHHYHLLIFGLVLSIILMAVAANLISQWIKKYKWIAWVGLLFYFPGLLFFFYMTTGFVLESIKRGERGMDTAWMPYMWPIKACLWFGILFLLIQGISEVLKSYYAAKKGKWPDA